MEKVKCLIQLKQPLLCFTEQHKCHIMKCIKCQTNKLPPTPLNFSALQSDERVALVSLRSRPIQFTTNKQAVLLTSLPHTVFFPWWLSPSGWVISHLSIWRTGNTPPLCVCIHTHTPTHIYTWSFSRCFYPNIYIYIYTGVKLGLDILGGGEALWYWSYIYIYINLHINLHAFIYLIQGYFLPL